MEASDGALSMFGVEHASAAITLRDPHGEKVLHLSPVALALRSAVFAARFRPGVNDWGPIVLEVESVAIVETLLRQCYVPDFANVSQRLSDPLEWSEIAIYLRTCDMLQMTPDIFHNLLHRVDAGATREEISAAEALAGLLDMRETSVSKSLSFFPLLRGLASAITRRAPDLDAAIAGIPASLRADVMWLALQSFIQPNRSNILPMIAKSIDSDDDSAATHLRYLAQWRQIAAFPELRASDEGYYRAIDIVRRIEGDESGESLRLRARDRFACLLFEIAEIGGRSKKRARDESGENEDFVIVSDSDSSE